MGWRPPRGAGFTSVEDLTAPEVEDFPCTVPLVQGWGELGGWDVQVHGHQGDADQTDMQPPLPHVHLIPGGGLIPAPRATTDQGCTGTDAKTVFAIV